MSFGNELFGEEPFGSGEDDEAQSYPTDHRNPSHDGTPRDLAVNERQDIFFAANGDLAVVNGRENIKQSAAIDVLHTIDPEIGGTVKPTTINRVQSEIRSVLQDDPQIEGVVSVEPTSYNTEDKELRFSATTVADDEYRIPIQSMAQSYTTTVDGDEQTYDLDNEKRY